MAFPYPDSIHPRLARLIWADTPGPSGAFARAVLIGALGVAGLARVLPGAGPSAILLAVIVFCLAGTVAGRVLRRDYPHDRLGWCNYITLLRLVVVCALIAPVLAGGAISWVFFALAAGALSLDGVDGWLARRQGLASAFGARFDVEVDSGLALVLALNAASGTGIGAVAVLLGLPRYAFCLAGLALPWMRRALPERFSRKVVCVGQLGALIALQAPALPAVVMAPLVSVTAASLVWSFAIDVLWLWRRRA